MLSTQWMETAVGERRGSGSAAEAEGALTGMEGGAVAAAGDGVEAMARFKLLWPCPELHRVSTLSTPLTFSLKNEHFCEIMIFLTLDHLGVNCCEL